MDYDVERPMRRINTSRGNTRALLTNVGYRSIRGFRRDSPEYRSNEEAYRFLIELWNDEVDLRNRELQQRIIQQKKLKEEKQRREKKRMRKLAKQIGLLRNGETLNLTINNNNEGVALFTYLASNSNKVLFNIPPDVSVPLNPANTERYKIAFRDNKFYTNEEETQDSFSQQVIRIINSGDVSFSGVEVRGEVGGSFFPYKHTLDSIDLSFVQIKGMDDTFNDKEESCFIKALREQGVNEEILTQIGFMSQVRNMPQRFIGEVCEKFNLYISVKSLTSAKHIRRYGNIENKEIKIGLIENHYFSIHKTDMTSYAIEHYNELKDEPDFKSIVGMRKNNKKGVKKYFRSKERFIDTYALIKILLENKDSMLKIASNEELYSSHFYNNLKYELRDITPYAKCLRMNNERKRLKKGEVKNIFIDFESTTDGDIHKPYLCSCDAIDKIFYGDDCAHKMLKAICEKYIDEKLRLVAHNASYDFRFLIEHLYCVSLIERGKQLLSGSGRFYYGFKKYKDFEIQDSYAIITTKLANFGNMFGIQQEKEFMPYNLYTEENVDKQYFLKEEIRLYCESDEFYDKFMTNVKIWGCLDGEYIDILKYSGIYCKNDCLVLKSGYNKFKENIREICDINVDNYISIASLANAYLVKEGVYDDVCEVSCAVLEFINRAMVGGRTMINDNKKRMIDDLLVYDDAVSLYPSAMVRLGGYLKGIPKLITNETYDDLKKYDGYFVEIEINEVGKKFKFPLMSYINPKNGVRQWTNDMVGKKIVVDKQQLEDLIEYHKIKFTIDRGYYYNDGRNFKLRKVIKNLFQQKKKAKEEHNKIENIYKLLLNSSYGFTLKKAIEEKVNFIPAKQYEAFITKNFNRIKEINKLFNGSYKIKEYKTIDNHFNYVSCGVEVLSMSKHIMNEVMVLAEQNNIDIEYQDTDGIFFKHKDRLRFIELYEKKYKRPYLGTDLGQFHNDFKSKKITGDIVGTKGYFLGKKCYVVELNNGLDYHIRMKGVSEASIRHYSDENNIGVMDIYKNLYNGESVRFDLLCGGNKVSFDFKKDYTITSREKFERVISFK